LYERRLEHRPEYRNYYETQDDRVLYDADIDPLLCFEHCWGCYCNGRDCEDCDYCGGYDYDCEGEIEEDYYHDSSFHQHQPIHINFEPNCECHYDQIINITQICDPTFTNDQNMGQNASTSQGQAQGQNATQDQDQTTIQQQLNNQSASSVSSITLDVSVGLGAAAGLVGDTLLPLLSCQNDCLVEANLCIGLIQTDCVLECIDILDIIGCISCLVGSSNNCTVQSNLCVEVCLTDNASTFTATGNREYNNAVARVLKEVNHIMSTNNE